jgi:short-subunit dehydrogenase
MRLSIQDTVLITGASSGLGRELARQLGPRVGRLILVARRRALLEELAAELRRPGLVVDCFEVDLAVDESLHALLEAVRGEKVTVLVNNAGLGDHGVFEESDRERIEAMLAVNIGALVWLTRVLLPGMLREKHGTVLNVSSIAGDLPVPGMAVYAATKAFVTSFSEALRAELRGAGVNVLTLCPGPVDTGFRAVARRGDGPELLKGPGFFKVDVEQVAREGIAAMEQGVARRTPGLLVRTVMGLAAALPMAMVRPFFPKQKRV